MSIDKVQEEVDLLLDERDKLEVKCDTLPECEQDDGCNTCETYKKIAEFDAKIAELEEKIESMMQEEEEDEDE